MFSGKTEELIRRTSKAKIEGKSVRLFKHEIDSRYHTSAVVSHNSSSSEAISIASPSDILKHIQDIQVVGIDEAQFFEHSIVDVCNQLANKGIRVIVSGLDLDYKGRPFGPMPDLMAVAEYVSKLHAVCSISGEPASFSYRKTNAQTDILLGANDHYEPRSRRYFYEL